jgi:hypothetical protein
VLIIILPFPRSLEAFDDSMHPDRVNVSIKTIPSPMFVDVETQCKSSRSQPPHVCGLADHWNWRVIPILSRQVDPNMHRSTTTSARFPLSNRTSLRSLFRPASIKDTVPYHRPSTTLALPDRSSHWKFTRQLHTNTNTMWVLHLPPVMLRLTPSAGWLPQPPPCQLHPAHYDCRPFFDFPSTFSCLQTVHMIRECPIHDVVKHRVRNASTRRRSSDSSCSSRPATRPLSISPLKTLQLFPQLFFLNTTFHPLDLLFPALPLNHSLSAFCRVLPRPSLRLLSSSSPPPSPPPQP